MLHLFNLFLITLVLLNTTGLGLAAHRFLRLPYGLSLGAAVAGVCAVLFFAEHFLGLGQIGWVLPVTTLGAAWLVWTRRSVLLENRGANAWLLVGFCYALLWRYTYPDIDANTERLPDLSFVTSFARGERLPGPDLWYPPFTLNHYYAFQHYGAGLLARLFHVNSGIAYNIAYCLLTGLTMTVAYEAVRPLCSRRWGQVLVLSAFLAGGTGASLFTPFMIQREGVNVEKPWDSMRFIGGTTFYEDDKLTAFGRAIKRVSSKPGATRLEVQEMPMETLAYVVELGDYHAPLAGFFLLAFGLGLITVLRREPAHPVASAALAATLPLTVAANTWSLPLQGALVLAVLGYLALTRGGMRQLHWPALGAGAAVTSLLFYPFFAYFLVNNPGNKAPIRFVPTTATTTLSPPVTWLIVFWPVLVIGLLHLFSARRERKLLAVFWLALLALTELFFVDDIYGGSSERFNTTLKWWPWVFNGMLLTLAAANLDAASSRLRRWATAGAVGALLVYLLPLASYWWAPVNQPGVWKTSKSHLGRLDGTGWLRTDEKVSSLLDFLKAQPPGIVLEAPDERAFCQVGAFAVFTDRPALIGWASHENLWRSDQTDINNRYDQARAFYRGELAEPLRFLEKYGVRYALWLPRDNPPPNSTPEVLAAAGQKFQQLSAALAPDYDWHQFYGGDPYFVGVWVKR